jgi:hypothetical protein
MSLQNTFEQVVLFEQALKKANQEHFALYLRDFCEKVMQVEAERLGFQRPGAKGN